jgi:CDGSH-type Zn-finger protein
VNSGLNGDLVVRSINIHDLVEMPHVDEMTSCQCGRCEAMPSTNGFHRSLRFCGTGNDVRYIRFTRRFIDPLGLG